MDVRVHKESWALKNWCFWTVVLEETLESPLDCKEIKLVNPKGNQSWIFTGRTDDEAEVPILWPPDTKNWLIGKDPDAGKDWRQEEKGMTEDEMVGWHHWLNGREFEQAPGVGDGQGSLVCCRPWEQLSWTELRETECTHALQGMEQILVCPGTHLLLCPALWGLYMGGQVRNSPPFAPVTGLFMWMGWRGKGTEGRHSQCRSGCRLRLLFILWNERSLMDLALDDIQKFLKKQDLSFWVWPELQGHGCLEEEFTSPGENKGLHRTGSAWLNSAQDTACHHVIRPLSCVWWKRRLFFLSWPVIEEVCSSLAISFFRWTQSIMLGK